MTLSTMIFIMLMFMIAWLAVGAVFAVMFSFVFGPVLRHGEATSINDLMDGTDR